MFSIGVVSGCQEEAFGLRDLILHSLIGSKTLVGPYITRHIGQQSLAKCIVH